MVNICCFAIFSQGREKSVFAYIRVQRSMSVYHAHTRADRPFNQSYHCHTICHATLSSIIIGAASGKRPQKYKVMTLVTHVHKVDLMFIFIFVRLSLPVGGWLIDMIT